MFLLIGERIHSHSDPAGSRPCSVCGGTQAFTHIVETNYFTVFGIRLLPIETYSDYLQCDRCGNSYLAEDMDQPSQVPLVQKVLSYVQVGYGKEAHVDLVEDICIKVSGSEFPAEQVRALNGEIASGRLDIMECLKQHAASLNLQGKHQIIEAAFLMTHACCEIQYEDRLRLNLMGNALGVSIPFVNSVIEHVRAHGCYQVQRLLPTQTDTIQGQ